ncbi:MAG: hypothetical protein HFG99_05430 [Dorea sp.]|nr:hypothetical protein [Dorea sp.]
MLSDFLIEKSWGCGNWGGAELAEGAGKERIYVVEPTGDFEDDPNVTDKKFPGNLTKLSDGKLMETQTANYFSDIYPIDCAVLSANA